MFSLSLSLCMYVCRRGRIWIYSVVGKRRGEWGMTGQAESAESRWLAITRCSSRYLLPCFKGWSECHVVWEFYGYFYCKELQPHLYILSSFITRNKGVSFTGKCNIFFFQIEIDVCVIVFFIRITQFYLPLVPFFMMIIRKIFIPCPFNVLCNLVPKNLAWPSLGSIRILLGTF